MEEIEPTVVFQPIKFKNVKFSTHPSTNAEQETDSVIIFNEEHRIAINKSLMMERCAFFKYMSKHGFKEANAKEISINYNTDVTVFKALVDYIHTGEIRLTTANLEAVIVAAIYFQLTTLLKFCCGVMKENTDLKTVGQVYEFAKELALVKLRKAAVKFTARHFNLIAQSKVFYEWLASCMLELLSSDEVEASHEKTVLKFVFDWLNVDPNQRSEHAAELFRKLRFTFLNEKNIEEVMERNPNEKLGQILHQVASEFSNKITPARIYDKGIYMYGYNRETSDLLGDRGYHFVRYCPDDGNITVLRKPNIGLSEDEINVSVVYNKDIFMLVVNVQRDSSTIRMKVYDTKKDVWKWKTSEILESQFVEGNGSVSVCDEKIFAFLKATAFDVETSIHSLSNFCMMYCIKTNTWQRLPVFEGKVILSATTCGDSIYMTRRGLANLLQYKPSTGELIDIPCQYDLRFISAYKAIAYKSSILLLPQKSSTATAFLFNSETKELRSFYFTEMNNTNDIFKEELYFSLFRNFVFVFTRNAKNNFKIDLSFIDESKKPTLIPLPNISGMKLHIWYAASIQ